MSSSDRPAWGSGMAGLRFCLGICTFCLGVHFLVTDLAFFTLNATIRNLPGKTASLRIADNDHQEDDFSRSGLAAPGDARGPTLPVFNQPVFASNRAISPLFLPPKA